jgi:hypothetical protein
VEGIVDVRQSDVDAVGRLKSSYVSPTIKEGGKG